MSGRFAASCRQLLGSHAAPFLPSSAAHCRQQAAGYSGRPPARATYPDSRFARSRASYLWSLPRVPLLHTACTSSDTEGSGLARSSRCCSAAQGPALSVWGPVAFCASTSAAAFALAASASDERDRSFSDVDRVRQHLGKPYSTIFSRGYSCRPFSSC